MERIDLTKRYTWWRPCGSEWYYYLIAGDVLNDILNDVPENLSGVELAALVEKLARIRGFEIPGENGTDCVIRWREISD